MAKKDLAGLAALGALGYMLSKGKGDAANVGESSDYTGGLDRNENFSNEGRTPVRAPSRAPSRVSNAGEDMREPVHIDAEAGMTRGTRPRDPRDAEKGMSRGTRSTSMAGAGRGMVNPSVASQDPDMSAYVPRRSVVNSTTEEGMSNYVPRRTSGPLTDVNRPGTRVRYENEDAGMKKGGKVSSASRRADGIATKGKTRGRYL